MLEALINGERDPGVLADMARQRMRSKIPKLTEALTGRFTDAGVKLSSVASGRAPESGRFGFG